MANMENYDQLLKAYASFKSAIDGLSSAVEHVEGTWLAAEDVEDELNQSTKGTVVDTIDFAFKRYPFDKSFDEVAYDIYDWAEEVDAWFNAKLDQYSKM